MVGASKSTAATQNGGIANRTPSSHQKERRVKIEITILKIPPLPPSFYQIYQFNGKPTAQVLLRTQRPLANARSPSASLFCVDGCQARRNAEEDAAAAKTNSRSRSCSSDLPPPPPPPGQPPRSLDGQLFASLQAFTASLQAVPSRYSLSTKVLVLGAEPRSYFVLSGGQNNRRRCLMEHERTYSLAIESRQQIDYHPLRAAVTCPSDGLVVFNYLAAALTFLLLAAGEVQFQVVGAAGGDGGGDEVLWPLLLVVLPALVGALFLLSGHYLFVTHLQDRLLGRSLGRSTGAWLLHYGLLTVLTVFGLLCCLGAVTLIAAGVDIDAGGGGGGGGGHHDHHSSTTSSSSSSSSTTTEKDSGSKTPSSSAKHHHHHPHHLNIASLTTFLLVALSWAVLFAIEGLLALLDHFFRCFNGVLSGGSFCACCCCCCCMGFGFCGCSSSCCDDPEESCPRLRNLPATSTAPTEEFGRKGGGRKGGRKGGGKKGGGKKSRGKRKGRNSSSK